MSELLVAIDTAGMLGHGSLSGFIERAIAAKSTSIEASKEEIYISWTKLWWSV